MGSNIYTDGHYIDKNPTYHVEDSPWKAQQILRMLSRNELQPRRICEIGCGAGEILRQLSLHLSDTTTLEGFEISPHGFELCKQRQSERLRFNCANLLVHDTEQYDIVLCIDVFEHVDDYLGFLRQLRGKGEYKIFHIPLDLSAQTILRARPVLGTHGLYGHIHFFFKDTAMIALKEAGYTVIDYFYTPSSLDRPKSLKGRFAKLPRKLFFWLNEDLAVRALGGYSLLVLAK